MMSEQPMMPSLSVDLRLIGNLRHARLEIEELGIQLDELLAKFDQESRQQRLQQIQIHKSISLSTTVLPQAPDN